jgi:neurofibromin 1
MRANSMASKLMKSLSSMIGKQFLQNTFGDIVKEICASPNTGGISFEVDPDKLKPTETLEKNQEKLKDYSGKILRRIFDSLDQTPLYVLFESYTNVL